MIHLFDGHLDGFRIRKRAVRNGQLECQHRRAAESAGNQGGGERRGCGVCPGERHLGPAGLYPLIGNGVAVGIVAMNSRKRYRHIFIDGLVAARIGHRGMIDVLHRDIHGVRSRQAFPAYRQLERDDLRAEPPSNNSAGKDCIGLVGSLNTAGGPAICTQS